MKKYRLKKKFMTMNGDIIEPQILEYKPQILPLAPNQEEHTISPHEYGYYYGIEYGGQFKVEFVETNTEFFEEIIEKKDVLRWDNGAIMEIPEGYSGDLWEVRVCWQQYLPTNIEYPLMTEAEKKKLGYEITTKDNIFLEYDRACNNATSKSVKSRVVKKIKQLDMESGWQYDPYNSKQECWTAQWDYKSHKKIFIQVSGIDNTRTIFSPKAKQYLENLQWDYFKLFLGVEENMCEVAERHGVYGD
jgi:hypothetical protein